MDLILPYPPSVNTYWRHVGSNKVLVSAKGRRYRREVAEALLIQRAKRGLTGRLSVEIEAVAPDRRVRDIDNILKAPLDALTHAGLWVDDSQVRRLLTVFSDDVLTGGILRVRVDPLEALGVLRKAA